MIKAATAATDRPALLVCSVPLASGSIQPISVHASIPCPQLQLLHQLVPVSLPLQPSVTTSPPVSVQLSFGSIQPMRVHASVPCPQLQLLHQLVPVSLPLQPSVTTSPPVSVQLSLTDVMPTPLQSELFFAQVVEFQ